MLDLEGLAEFLTFGFMLEGKTMRKELSCLTLASSIEHNINSSIDDVYVALIESMERLIRSDTGLALSGGLDSRILAGIAAELEEKIPTFTWGFSNFERVVAQKVASTLKLSHYVINMDMRLSEESIEELRHFAVETGGTINLANLCGKTYLSQRLKDYGVKELISAYGFDEVNGGDFAYKVNSTQRFCDVFVQKYAHPSLPPIYREIAKRNLSECCKNISLSELYPLVYVKNLLKDFRVEEWIRDKTPVADRGVLSTISSLPLEQRINKRMQKAILRKHFPRLYKIPYAMSGLAPFLPYSSHIYMRKLLRLLFGFTSHEKPRPLLTFDYQWFIRINLPLLRKLLFSNVPPYMNRMTVQEIVYRLQTTKSIRDAVFLDKLSTYSLLAS